MSGLIKRNPADFRGNASFPAAHNARTNGTQLTARLRIHKHQSDTAAYKSAHETSTHQACAAGCGYDSHAQPLGTL